MSPPLFRLEHRRTHRLIASKHDRPALADLFDDDDEAAAVFDLDGATNDRLIAEAGRIIGISIDELVSGVPYASIVNAAFTHPHPYGGRFNTSERGAWYAAFELETALAEVIFHHTAWLREIDRWHDAVTKDEWCADFTGEFHDLREPGEHAGALDPDPATGYPLGQALAAALIEAGSLGSIYPAVRNPGGTNIACFRPALVQNVQRGKTVALTWNGSDTPIVG